MRIFIVAGEASGDVLGAGLISALRQCEPHIDIEGIVGPHMEAQGCKKFASIESLSVMGMFDVLANLIKIIRLRKKLISYLLKNPPDVYVGIDAPDFNLTIEKKLRQAGIKTVHYHSPSLWAWRKKRIYKIADATELMLTLFPFETPIYQQHNIPVQYVGHPTADSVPLQVDQTKAQRQLNLPQDKKIIALLPGSRSTEIHYLGEVFLRAAQLCVKKIPEMLFVVPLVNDTVRSQFEILWKKIAPELPLILVNGNSHTVLAAADGVIVASGTATLEAMLFKRPMVVAYRMSPVTYWIAKRLIKITHIALPNILAKKTIVPEFIQDKATAENISEALLQQLNDPVGMSEVIQTFTSLHLELKHAANFRAAKAVLELITD